jgi:hypothetical protein
MKKIYKYELKKDAHQLIDLPAGSKILYLGVQRDIPCMWVEVGCPGSGYVKVTH